MLLTLSLIVYLDNLFNNWRRQSLGPVIVATSLAMFARRNNELRSRVMVPADAEKYKLEEQIVFFYDHLLIIESKNCHHIPSMITCNINVPCRLAITDQDVRISLFILLLKLFLFNSFLIVRQSHGAKLFKL